MTVYVVTYDLRKPGRNYDGLYKKIKSYSTWAHIVESTWAIVSTDTAVKVRDNLAGAMDSNDQLFVSVLRAPAAWRNLPDDVTDWLKKNLD